MADDDYYKMRAAVCRVAVTLADNDPAHAASITLGAAAGFVLSAAHHYGWDPLLAHINELAKASRVPAVIEKPALKLVEGGKV
jgi:hypothetical protein